MDFSLTPLFFCMQSINRSAEGEGSSFSRGKKKAPDHRKRRRDSVGCAVNEKKGPERVDGGGGYQAE